MERRPVSWTRSRPRISGTAVLPLRLFLGGMFLYAGLQKFHDPAFLDPNGSGSIWEQMQGFVDAGSPLSALVNHIALPHAKVMGELIAWAEIWIGLATLLGVLTSFAAIGGLGLSLIFFLTASWTVRPFFLGPDLPFAAGWLTLLLSGPGSYSLEVGMSRIGSRQTVDGWPVPSPRFTRSALLRGVVSAIVLAATAGVLGNFTGRRGSATAGNSDELALNTGEPAEPPAVATQPNTPTVAEQSRAPRPGATRTAEPTPSPSATAESAQTAAIPAGFQVLGAVDAVPLNSAKRFTDPATGVPAIVVHMPDDSFVAFNSKCTHEGCKVRYNQDRHLLRCPCHDALFDPADAGAVRQGPAKRPLKPIDIRVGNDGNLYVKGG